jgi:hypothetical protein
MRQLLIFCLVLRAEAVLRAPEDLHGLLSPFLVRGMGFKQNNLLAKNLNADFLLGP